MATVLIVTSKVKAFAKKKHELRTSADFIVGLSKQVEQLIEAAAVKAQEAKRKTIQLEDL